MKIPYFHVDAFTANLFAGNPAGVCLLDSWPDDSLLQKIAAENNLSETAFIVPVEPSKYELKWFTPTIEIDLCGHATLASAFVLDQINPEINWPVHFSTKSGTLSVEKSDDLFFLDFPSRPAASCSVPAELVQGLGASPTTTLKSRDYLAVFASPQHVIDLQPDFSILAQLDCLGIIVTAPGNDVDFVSRFFAPAAGVPEDPVTGSSHCTLIPYWAEQTGKQQMVARQLSHRSGELVCQDCGERVRIGGRAVLYHSGYITI